MLRCSVSQQSEQSPVPTRQKVGGECSSAWELFLYLINGGSDYERMTCAKWLHQPFQQWKLTDKKKETDTKFCLSKKRFQPQSVLIFVSPVSSNGRNVSLKGEPYVPDNPGLFRSHGFLRGATTG